ncbi:hypothetical protein [Plantactinospora sp. WMMB782]|uniref:hypothetical protein n=1 Tax=Plantactinospora sp. WMMB782 TaxID=3404121 RepID=UPI003B9392F8
MAFISFPFDNADTTEGQYSRLFRELQDTGVVDAVTGAGFRVWADASGMLAKVDPGSAILRGHMVSSDAVETRAIGAASASERIDRIVLRLDPAANGISIEVLQGTPGDGPPALTQTDVGVYEFALARITVSPGVSNIAADKVTGERQFVGSRVRAWTTATRPASPRVSQLGLNVTTGDWEYWTGSAWANLVPNPVANSARWGGYSVTVSTTTPAGSPTTDRIWIQPTS